MNTNSTVAVVSLALDAALMRQTAIANNIANSNTPGYQTMEVSFEEQLLKTGLSAEEISTSVKPFYQLSDAQSSIDEQMALNVKNMTHYRALIRGLNQQFSIMKLALQGTNQ